VADHRATGNRTYRTTGCWKPVRALFRIELRATLADRDGQDEPRRCFISGDTSSPCFLFPAALSFVSARILIGLKANVISISSRPHRNFMNELLFRVLAYGQTHRGNIHIARLAVDVGSFVLRLLFAQVFVSVYMLCRYQNIYLPSRCAP
jgi:hypothetical protein